MKKLDTDTLLEIIKRIDDQRTDLTAMFEETRPRELRDCQWVFKNDYVKYGAETALRHLYYELQSLLDTDEVTDIVMMLKGKLNASENQTEQ